MKKMSAETANAFPLKSQYVNSITQAREAEGDDEPHEIEDDDDEVPGPTVKAKKAKAKAKVKSTKPSAKRKATNLGKDGKRWNYNQVRMKFIKEARNEHDLSFEAAQHLWDESSAKKDFLKDVSVQELKRRKFIPKGSTENPWAN